MAWKCRKCGCDKFVIVHDRACVSAEVLGLDADGYIKPGTFVVDDIHNSTDTWFECMECGTNLNATENQIEQMLRRQKKRDDVAA